MGKYSKYEITGYISLRSSMLPCLTMHRCNENRELSWCQLCRHWRQHRLSGNCHDANFVVTGGTTGCPRIVMMQILSSLAATQVVVTTTCGAAGDDKVGITTTLFSVMWVMSLLTAEICRLLSVLFAGYVTNEIRLLYRTKEVMGIDSTHYGVLYSIQSECKTFKCCTWIWGQSQCRHVGQIVQTPRHPFQYTYRIKKSSTRKINLYGT